jgi:hypothetical protein
MRKRRSEIDLILTFSASDRTRDREIEGVWEWSVLIQRKPELEDSKDAVAVKVGHACVIVFDLDTVVDIDDSADAIGDNLLECTTTLLDTGTLNDDLLERYLHCSRLLLLNDIVLEKSERGKGIGPAAARAIVRRLGGGRYCLVAADVRPEGWWDMKPAARRAATRKVERTFGGIGLEKYQQGPYWTGDSGVVGWTERFNGPVPTSRYGDDEQDRR